MNEKAKILIVEDERIIARAMRHKLESMGYAVPATVSSGEEAITKAQELQPDLILMDIILRGEMDGVEAAGQIRARFGIPVVYITANVSDARLEDITRSEPFGCVFKPFEDMELRAAREMALYRYKMEKKLRESELRYRFLASTADAMYLVDKDCRFLFMNEQYRERLGMELREIIGNTYGEFHPAEEARTFAEKVETIFKTGKPIHYEHRSRRDEKYFIRTLSPVKNTDGETTAVTVVSKDITDRRQAEEALRKSEERFRAIIEGMQDGYYEADLAGRFTFFNEAMRRILGFSADELMGMSDLEYTSPETAKRLYKTFNKVYRTGKPANVQDYEIIRRDGSTRTLEFNVSLMRDEKGEPAGFRGIVRDVTKRREMENELERRFQYLEGVLKAAPYAVITLDRHHHIVRWNPGAERLFRYSKEEVIGRDLDSLVATTADTLDEAKKATKTTMSGGNLSPFEAVRFRKDGSPVNVIVYVSPIMVDGELVGAVTMYGDISDRKQAEAEIKSHQEHIALINQILRHDLTNDLVVIQSAINLYNESPEEGLLEEISSRTEKSLELIKNMRELEFFVSRHRKLKVCDMRDVIETVVENYPSVAFKIKGKARVMADDALSSVIDNIIGNAVIHGKADRIVIAIGKERDMCEVRIADNGTGIPDDIKEKIFEEGFIYGDTGHTGLGLHIVEKAMESYGGYAYVEDNEPKGTVIALRFRMVK
ncbi:MAG: PAS domain S-box protein [Syntrophaceae bacterium]|nr:PAS domain S-box protein [Syntrophaceae bacterium]